jgi:hypothetical protein
MKSVVYVGLAMRLLVAAASPAHGAPVPNAETLHPSVESTKPVSSVRPWTSGNETATLPWSAPRGHHQPRLVDIPASPREDHPSEDVRIDRIVGNVCRNC